jgi:signal transduction histidine kinase
LYVARGAQGETERAAALEQLQRGVERAVRLVGQMLTLARLDPEQPLPDPHAVSLGEVAQSVCAELAPLAMLRGQTLALDVKGELPALSGNADLLSMLLCNLADNAIRYTPNGGHIDMALRAEPEGLWLEVIDDGPGIAPAQRERVFDRFYRIATQDQPGTGLGLAICRRVAELHGAQITLSDGPNGKGLAVRVLLPPAA